jgi:hypothetical protein
VCERLTSASGSRKGSHVLSRLRHDLEQIKLLQKCAHRARSICECPAQLELTAQQVDHLTALIECP